MARYKTVVYEEIVVYDVTYQRWVEPRPYYDGGDGPGSVVEARAGYHWTYTKRSLTEAAKNKLVRRLNRNRGNRDHSPRVRTRKVWQKINEKISSRKPACARVS